MIYKEEEQQAYLEDPINNKDFALLSLSPDNIVLTSQSWSVFLSSSG